jgi:hypothetical protein
MHAERLAAAYRSRASIAARNNVLADADHWRNHDSPHSCLALSRLLASDRRTLFARKFKAGVVGVDEWDRLVIQV